MSPVKYRDRNRYVTWGEWLYNTWRENIAGWPDLAEYARASLPEYEKLRQDVWQCWEALGTAAATSGDAQITQALNESERFRYAEAKELNARIGELQSALSQIGKIRSAEAAKVSSLLDRVSNLESQLASANAKLSQVPFNGRSPRIGHTGIVTHFRPLQRAAITAEDIFKRALDDDSPAALLFCSKEEELQVRELIESVYER